MKTFLSDIFPKIQRYSEKLDNITLLTNQHWVSINDMSSSKIIYIFRTNNDLLVSTNGKVEKAKWEYLGNKSLLIDRNTESYLFKHGFFDENILALKVDGSEEYAVFVNENNYDGELNSIERVFRFLKSKYLDPSIISTIEHTTGRNFKPDENKTQKKYVQYHTDRGIVEISPCTNLRGQNAYLNGQPAPDGKYKFGFLWTVEIKNGKVIKG
jgi:hypothetical protein